MDSMDKPILKNSMRLFERLGQVKSRSMFGGFGIFINDTMCALIVNNQLHLRTTDETAPHYQALGYQAYCYKKRGFPVITKYFALPDSCWNNTDDILEQAKQALNLAQQDRQQKETNSPDRLKDLPNLRLSTERMLKKAGIETVTQLQNQGSVAAYKAICKTHTTEVDIKLLWALEGAISGQHWSVIPLERRDQLLQQVQ